MDGEECEYEHGQEERKMENVIIMRNYPEIVLGPWIKRKSSFLL